MTPIPRTPTIQRSTKLLLLSLPALTSLNRRSENIVEAIIVPELEFRNVKMQDVVECDAVSRGHVAVGKRSGLGEMCKCFIETCRERRVLRAFNDREIFLFFEVAQIAFGREIAERIEGHGFASRKYFT